MEALDFGFSGEQLVKKEAILNWHNNTWSSFLCVLGMASVTNRNIYCYYPDFGEPWFTLLFKCKIEPCPPLTVLSDLYILFCFKGIVKSGGNFKCNHFVTLVYRDQAASKGKRKLQTVSPDICRQKTQRPEEICSVNTIVQSEI